MKVLAIGNRDPFTVTGGYERIFRSVVDRLRAEGHTVHVATADDVFQWYWRDGDFFEPSWRERRAIERHNQTVLASLLAEGPDVVSWWGMGGMSLGLIEQVRQAGLPAVGVVGDGWMIYGPKVDRPVALGPCAHWIFISRIALERAQQEGYHFPSASIAHPGVNREEFPRAEPRGWAGRLAYVGRVSPEKGVDTARRAADLLGLELRIAGPGTDALSAYREADAVLFPSEWPEPWGLVPLEAMSVGRPVVATGTGGSAEYLEDGINCLLFPPGDAEALADRVRQLAEDPELRARLREGGFATAARYEQADFDTAVIDALIRVR